MKLWYEDCISVSDEGELALYKKENRDILMRVASGEECYQDYLGWFDPEEWGNEALLARLEEKAKEVQDHADAFVLVGVGGSNNAARSVIKALEKEGKPTVYYAGNSISANSINKLLKQLEGKSVYINLIAKNFETLEPGIGFRVLRVFLKGQYGERANQHIIVTGTPGSHLHQLCEKHGYTFLTFPQRIGGRYSAISDVGLFPMAVAGVEIRKLVQGAKDMREQLLISSPEENMAYHYACIRNLLYRKGYRMEMLSFFEPELRYFAKWWIQLFAESEGKEGKGLYPVSAEYSEDLHSVGQFVQEGTHVILETFLEIMNPRDSLILHKDEVEDGFDYLDEVDFRDINRNALEATFKAHTQCLPCLRIQIETIDEYTFGQLFYFFEYACYISGTLLGINPFDQPGVEAYKSYMFDALGR